MSIKANSPLGREILSRFNTADRDDSRRQERKADAVARTAEAGLFDAFCKSHGLPPPVHEFPFAPWEGGQHGCPHVGKFKCRHCGATRRRWRFDYIWEGWLAVERVGGVWTGGHHSGGQSQLDDFEKHNNACLLGFVTLFFTPKQFETGEALAMIRKVLGSEANQS